MNPTLPLTQNERMQLRKAKVKISEIHTISTSEIAQILHLSIDKAKVYKGLADFQSVPSIGFHLADKLVSTLKIYSLNEMKNQNGSDLFNELEQCLGVWTDACVEDQIRCVIHYANHPTSDKRWFDFTDERKNHRAKIGYP
ncbi:helix-hairpin-helix domain-containing protein [Pseudalkalibacillus hwajinpoensis]|uniref:helix-hairpin-helix domain-containing protein n=1 Tax=Guptibacillus hwajinpoensis TaxID=208199 RepID=UPI001CFE298F|nr:helix-hairpin-helix domain-containing protein [Pseudalkalibacillus hwajinpoensis]